ncbi:MAG TPA: SGNH/GDSL hydrolase family protein [Bryobacteraceae bacterium]|nr:SGNH/GDSL hydrolase family protein [Bryobacteraceae bacterium]
MTFFASPHLSRRAAGAALACILAAQVAVAQSTAGTEHWVGTWATAAVVRPPVRPASPGQAAPQQPAQPAPFTINNQTLRQIVHVSVGGSRARVVLTNAFGTAPLSIGAAQVALRESDAKIVPASNRTLTFDGRPSVTIPTGGLMFSDPVNLTVPSMSDLAIDLFLPGDLRDANLTSHFGANQTNYASNTGNFAGAADFPVSATTPSWFFLERVEVAAPAQVGAVIAFGDSITDGTRSTPNTDHRWPDQLAKRLLAKPGGVQGVLNEAIAGNRLLTEANIPFGINALARFDRDVLGQTGATHMIVLEGINDIGMARQPPGPSAEDLIAAHRQLIERAHAHGLKIYGCTLLPYEGAAYFTADGEAKRQALNNWMRTSKAYDAVIDFDALVRDPQNPTKIQAQYDSGDHLHPNDAGYQAMGGAIDLKLFESGTVQAPAKAKRR